MVVIERGSDGVGRGSKNVGRRYNGTSRGSSYVESASRGLKCSRGGIVDRDGISGASS
jgi:hypothetical protein